MAAKLYEIRKRNKRTFDEIAEEYDYRRRAPWQDCLTPFGELGVNALILDAGAGTGRQTLALGERNHNVVALDFSVNMLKRLQISARRLHRDARTSMVVADIVELPLRENSFDGIELVAALHHLPSKMLRCEAISEFHRITREGGICVITVWRRFQRGFYRMFLRSALSALIGKSELGDAWINWEGRPRFYHLFTYRELKKTVSAPGFQINYIEEKIFGERASGPNKNLLVQAHKISNSPK